MRVKKVGEKYFCKVCGNKAKASRVGSKKLVCCGQEITLMTE